MRVLVFGDSITQGYWDTEGGWVDKLRKHYDELQIQDFNKDQPTIFNLGISADTSRNVLARAEGEIKARTRHNTTPIVIVQIGINDSCAEPGGNMVPIEDYKANLEKIIEALQPISSKLIFVGLSACDEAKTTPVSWGKFHYTNKSINEYEAQMRAVASEHYIPFVPVFDKFTKAMKNNDLFADGLHPNNEGHMAIFDIVKPKLIPLLEA
ncbi:MAG TPA: SGNH/GDSL hydrolase family protein [Candidatus Saccharimonadales bacterium]|nr:SGNH/GDSL hydrolase family protein [Candidatus Saccharimonadales bacterium]